MLGPSLLTDVRQGALILGRFLVKLSLDVGGCTTVLAQVLNDFQQLPFACIGVITAFLDGKIRETNSIVCPRLRGDRSHPCHAQQRDHAWQIREPRRTGSRAAALRARNTSHSRRCVSSYRGVPTKLAPAKLKLPRLLRWHMNRGVSAGTSGSALDQHAVCRASPRTCLFKAFASRPDGGMGSSTLRPISACLESNGCQPI